MSSTSNRTWKLEVVQVSGEDVFTEFSRILHGLYNQITSRQLALLGWGQELGDDFERPRLTVSPRSQ